MARSCPYSVKHWTALPHSMGLTLYALGMVMIVTEVFVLKAHFSSCAKCMSHCSGSGSGDRGLFLLEWCFQDKSETVKGSVVSCLLGLLPWMGTFAPWMSKLVWLPDLLVCQNLEKTLNSSTGDWVEGIL